MSKRYHLFKQTRLYSGEPYQGPTSNYQPAEYDTKEDAIAAAAEFNERNPVGWNVWDTETDTLVYGYNIETGQIV